MKDRDPRRVVTRAALAGLQEQIQRAELKRFAKGAWEPDPHQVPPPGDWYGWLMLAGRGAGKTDACANYVVEHVKGPACLPGNVPHLIGIIGPTHTDAVTSCYEGPSGIREHMPEARLIGSSPEGTIIRFPNGSIAKVFGASGPKEADALRAGGNRCLFWLEELAAWRYLDDCWNHMRFGLRSGPRPHWVGSTTPKPRPLIKKLDKGELRDVVVTRATTFDNTHLPEKIRAELEDTYGGTALGAQELYGRVIAQDENALWLYETIADLRVKEAPPLVRISVGVDPSGGGDSEQGIIVVGKCIEPIAEMDQLRPKPPLLSGYVLADYTCHLKPHGWGKRAVQAAIDFEADDICVETNFGGDMAIANIQGAMDGLSIPVRKLTASRGKRVRAEPVAALTEKGLWHHVGTFEQLEDQMCTWTPESDYSPDRLDAMVWPAWHMKLVSTLRISTGSSFGASEMAGRQIA
jgi:phage terminase large subunit-like protein